MRIISRLKYIVLPLCAAALAAWSAPSFAAGGGGGGGGGQPCGVQARVNVVAQALTQQNGTAPEKTIVQLNGSPSTNTNDATPVTYSWEQVPNDAGVLTSVGALSLNAKGDQATLTAPEVATGGATLKFKLTVTGAGCSPIAISTAYAYVTVTDVATNHAPTATLTVLPGTTIGENVASFTLDGSHSSDSDGDVLTYLFEQVFTDNSTLTLCGGASSANKCEVTTPDVGTAGASLRYRLTVWDTSNVQSVLPAEQIVNVTFVNEPPVAIATCSPAIPATVPEGGKVTLDGSASTDGDGDGIASREWTQKSGGPDAKLAETHVVDGPGIWSFTAPALKPNFGDTMVFELVVTDNGATGAAPMSAIATCSVQVRDVTPPEIDPATVPPNQNLEATSKDGAVATFEKPTATDNYSSVGVSCLPTSGSTFPLGTTTVTCTAVDEAGNSSAATFTIKVVDTTPPDLAPLSNVTAEATSSSGAKVTFAPPAATDKVDQNPTVTCSANSGDEFPLGATKVTCTASDFSGNSTSKDFTVTVQDTTPPAVTVPADMTKVEATGPSGAAVTFAASANDLVDGTLNPTCSPASGSTFPLGTTTVNCSATDAHSNTGSKSFKVTVVDTTPPAINVPADIVTKPTQWNGAVVDYGTVTATDLVDGTFNATCSPLGGPVWPFMFGLTTVTCTATDTAGNTASKSFTVKVTTFDSAGFFQPVDMALLNGIKAGQTVPLKWQLFVKDGSQVTTTSVVTSSQAQAVPCGNADQMITNDINTTLTTNGSSLRYDTTGAQFVLNWQTPKSAAGTCWIVKINFADGNAKAAAFKLK